MFRRDAGVAVEVSAKSDVTAEDLERARDELEGRTGETDSEADESD